jgi:diguanylate cyclase (GGDEF)-like protein
LTDVTLIETVADLTAERDRESLEATLAGLLRVQLDALEATCFRLVASDDGPRVWAVLRATADATTPLGDGADPRRLPPLDGDRARCVERRAALRRVSGGQATWLLPVLAEHDTLTALRNRRTFDADFQRLQRGAVHALAAAPLDARHPAPVDAPHWLAVVDVDRFKRFDDEYGHLYGDEVLLILAQMMRAQFRPLDRLYRFGGEEFVVVLARTAPEVARAPFERLRAAVAARAFTRVGRVTGSMGFTRIGTVDDAAGAFGRADAARYHAKQGGRDRVHAWEDLAAAGLVAPTRTEAVVELF